MNLTQKQKRFVQEYLICLNAAQAARNAGYSEKTANSMGQKNLTKPKIQEAISNVLDEVSSENIASIQEILEYFTSVMRGEIESEIVVIEGVGNGCSDARRMNKLPDAKERLRAAELLGKRYGLFSDKFNIEGGLPVIISGENEIED